MQRSFVNGCFCPLTKICISLAEKQEGAPQEHGHKKQSSTKWYVWKIVLRKVGRKSLWEKVWFWKAEFVSDDPHICVSSPERLSGVSMCMQNCRMSLTDLHLDALAHVVFAQSCVSFSQRTLCVGCLLCCLPTKDVLLNSWGGSGFNWYLQEHFPLLSPFKMALCSDEALGPGYGAANVGLREEQSKFEVLVG